MESKKYTISESFIKFTYCSIDNYIYTNIKTNFTVYIQTLGWQQNM